MIELEKIHKRYGHKIALESIDLTLSKGIYALLGPNGSGKTTLIRCLAGILKPTSGNIDRPEQIGYLPQKFGMYKELSVNEAMSYFATLKKIPAKDQHEKIVHALECVRLIDRLHDRIKTLSGGMVRRLGIAQTLLGNPSLILLDEPTAGLDPEERLAFKSMVKDIGQDRTLLISTHIVEDVEMSCDRIIIIKKGVILTNAPADDLRESARGKIFRTSIARVNQLTEPYLLIRKEFVDQQETLRILSAVPQPGNPVEPTLEDAYMLCLHGSSSS